MQGVFGVVVAALAASVAFLVAFERGRSRLRSWRETAAALGLTGVSETATFGIPNRLEGRDGSLVVCLSSYHRGKHESGTRIEIGGLGHGDQLSVRPEGIGSQVAKAFGDHEVALGDSDFDREAYVQGAPSVVRAVLGADARGALGALFSGRFAEAHGIRASGLRATLNDSRLRVEIRERPFDSLGPRLPAIVRDLAATGRLLLRPEDVAARLAEHVRSEPSPPARLVNLETLANEYPGHPATKPALLAALADPSPEVRLRAAVALGPEGRAVLVRLAGAEDVAETVAVHAIAALDSEYPEAMARDVLHRAVEAHRLQVARACVGRLAASGAAGCVPELGGLLASTDTELAVAAAAALGTVGEEAAEQALVAALDSEAGEVRMAAVGSLGRMGSTRAVASLHRCAAGRRFDTALHSAVRQAVAEIQSRVAGASPGQLTLASDDVGQVTLADIDVTGQVSLAEQHEGVGTSARTAGETPVAAGETPAPPEPEDGRRLQEQVQRARQALGGPPPTSRP